MKIIFSRKGFDSSSGGVPSPIFPDNRILSLPIPDKKSPISYGDIKWDEYDLGSIVTDMTEGRITPSWKAHLDPDIRYSSLPRADNWQPIFGQAGSSQGHLQKNAVQEGDIFLFFGLFQDVTVNLKRIVRKKNASARHVIWGWLQIDEAIDISSCDVSMYKWAQYHPHFHRSAERNNTLYVSKPRLSLPSMKNVDVAGSGVFSHFSAELQLTAPEATRPSEWSLPRWMYPHEGKAPLSYHGDLSRWQLTSLSARLNAVARGQEFILDCDHYPESIQWIKEIVTCR